MGVHQIEPPSQDLCTVFWGGMLEMSETSLSGSDGDVGVVR